MRLALGVLAACVTLLAVAGFVAFAVLGVSPSSVTAALRPGPTTAKTTVDPDAAGTYSVATLVSASTVTTVAPSTALEASAIIPESPTTSEPTTTTSTVPPGGQQYAAVAGTLTGTLTLYESRMTQLGDIVTGSAPGVSQTVLDELDRMVTELAAERADLSQAHTPKGLATAKMWLDRAARYMGQNAQYTLAAAEAMARTHRSSSGKSSLAKAQQARDSFQVAFAKYQQLMIGQ